MVEQPEPMAQAADPFVNKLLAENQYLKDRIRLLEGIPEAMYVDFGEGQRFTDMLGRMNPLHWHYCNITVRINGQDKHYQGDWLKQVYIAREKARIK